MKFFIFFVFLLLEAACLYAAQNQPNILLVMTDDQGWADIGRNRHLHPEGQNIHTPVLDNLSKESLWFNQAYAAAPNCSPTRASVLTGRNPMRTGVWSHGLPLRPQEASIAADLAAAGYFTGHYGKWHLQGWRGPGTPLHVEDLLNPSMFGFTDWASLSNYYDLNPQFGTLSGNEKSSGEGSIRTVEMANEAMSKAVADQQPFFLVVWFGSPHTPHIPAQEDLEACGGNKKLAEIRGVDRAVGMLMDHVEKLGVADNTLMWFTSDNGSQDKAGTGGLRGKKGQIWEGGIRVPAFIHWPGKITPGESNVPIVTSDIRPTLLSLTGVKEQKILPIDGVDLSSVLLGEQFKRSDPICFWFAGNVMKTPSLDEGHAAIVDGNLKLHGNRGKWVLYDLSLDVKESLDISKDKPEEFERLKGTLIEWKKSVISSSDGKDYVEKRVTIEIPSDFKRGRKEYKIIK